MRLHQKYEKSTAAWHNRQAALLRRIGSKTMTHQLKKYVHAIARTMLRHWPLGTVWYASMYTCGQEATGDTRYSLLGGCPLAC